jgi:hypothetical protein
MSISSIGFTFGRGATIIPGIASELRFGRRTRVGDLGDIGVDIGLDFRMCKRQEQRGFKFGWLRICNAAASWEMLVAIMYFDVGYDE